MIPLRIAIIGGGPSAAFAYRACWEMNLNPTVYADKFTTPSGAFYIHEMPPTCPPDVLQQYEKKVYWISIGTAEVYSEKMWNDPSIETSFPIVPRMETGYDPAIIKWLWTDLDRLQPCGKLSDDGVVALAAQYDLVIQTFPTDESKKYRTIEHVPVFTKSITPLDPIILLYSGDASPWVRATFSGDKLSLEYPKEFPITSDLIYWTFSSVPDLPPDTKPWTKGPSPCVELVGRFAQYDRKMLSHHAYDRTMKLLKRSRA